MKKLLRYWGDVIFFPLYIMVSLLTFSTIYSNAFWLISYAATFTVIALVVLVRSILKKQKNIRFWAYVIFGSLALIFITVSYAFMYPIGAEILEIEMARVELFWWFEAQITVLLDLTVIGFSATRIAIWLYKRHQAKRTPPQENNHDQDE